MTASAWGAGLVVTGALAVMLAASAWRLRRALLPSWHGAPARLGEVVVALSILTLVAQLLGTIGQFRRWSLVIAVAVVSATAWFLTRDRLSDVAREPPPPPASRAASAVAAALAAIVTAQWVARTISAFDHGILDVDSRQYHLPFAAFYAQSGWTTRLHIAWLDPVWSFYPGNSELLHATGILAFRHDVLSPVLNVGWLLLALLAGWCVGRPWGVGPATLAGVAVLVATPILSVEAGAATNDIVALALLFAAIALVLTPGPDLRLVVAGAAAGLAVGTKVTAIVPVAVLTVAVLASTRPWRRAAWLWTGPLLVFGSFWYLRNLFRTGNPLPPLDSGLPRPAFPVLDRYGYRVVDYIGSAHFWGTTVPDGLRTAFGPAWPALGVLAVAGVVLVLSRRHDAITRFLGLAAVAAAVAYAFTPASAYGTRNDPFLFGYNLRYLAPALGIGLVLLPLVDRLRARSTILLGVYAALVVVILWSPSAPLRPWPGAHRTAVVIVAAIGVLVAVGAAIVWTARGPKRRILLVAGVGGVVGVIVVAVGGYHVQRGYLAHRYTTTGSVDAWARGVSHARIGAVGYAAQYPLAGIDVSNSVEYIGWRVPHGGIQPARTCAEWRDVIGRSRYGYVVAGVNKWAIEPADEAAWTEGDPHAQVVARSPSATVFRLTGPLDPKGCAAT